MKHRTDTLAQQYRIRAEYAARKALEAYEIARAMERSRDKTLATMGHIIAGDYVLPSSYELPAKH